MHNSAVLLHCVSASSRFDTSSKCQNQPLTNISSKTCHWNINCYCYKVSATIDSWLQNTTKTRHCVNHGIPPEKPCFGQRWPRGPDGEVIMSSHTLPQRSERHPLPFVSLWPLKAHVDARTRCINTYSVCRNSCVVNYALCVSVIRW